MAVETLGKINIAHSRGVYSGVKLERFSEWEDLNRFFEKFGGQGVVMTELPQVDPKTGEILVFISKNYSDEEIAELNEISNLISAEMEKRKALRAENEAKIEAERIRQQVEAKRLQEVGRKCESNHGQVIEENSKLKKQLKKGK